MTAISLALSGASSYPRACQALSAMMSKNALNPADITVVRRGGVTGVNLLKPFYLFNEV